MEKNQKVLFGIVAAVVVLCVVVALVVNRGGHTEGDGDVIKIGVILPLTGPAAELGELSKRGIVLAADHINAHGEIHGRKIELIIEDAGLEPKRALDAYRKLKEIDGVTFYLVSVNFKILTTRLLFKK
jgi:ABC-type branched-subunit amino acid transport system substrate-binding protein